VLAPFKRVIPVRDQLHGADEMHPDGIAKVGAGKPMTTPGTSGTPPGRGVESRSRTESLRSVQRLPIPTAVGTDIPKQTYESSAEPGTTRTLPTRFGPL